jgi:hypothetical protein
LKVVSDHRTEILQILERIYLFSSPKTINIMKKTSNLLFKLLIGVLPVIAFIIYGCGKGTTRTAFVPPSYTTTLTANDTLENGLVLPIGTEISLHSNKPKTMHISFPGQYRFIGITVAQVAVELQDFDITCSCTSGTDGCSPFANSKASGCVNTGNCTTCTKKNSTSLDGADIELGDGAIIDLSSDIHFINNKAEVSEIPPAYPSLFFDSTVIQTLRSFVTANGTSEAFAVADTSTNGKLPKGYVYLPVSVYGRSLLVPVRHSTVSVIKALDYIPASNVVSLQDVQQVEATTSGYSCSCSAGPGCVKYAYYIPFLGMNYFCSAGSCMSCTLHTPS